MHDVIPAKALTGMGDAVEAELQGALAPHTLLRSDRATHKNAHHTPRMNASTVPHRLPGTPSRHHF